MTELPEQPRHRRAQEVTVSPRPVSTRVLVVVATIVGGIAIVGGYLGSSAPNPNPAASRAPGQSPALAPSPVRSTLPTAEVQGAYKPEVGPFALLWAWLGDQGSIGVTNASGESGYVGMLALSEGRRRAMRVGTSAAQTIDTAPRSYLFGPLKLANGDIPIGVMPGARRASSTDTRRISVFLSTPVVAHQPFVGVPSKGFYPRESAGGRSFYWMGGRGVLDLAAPPTTTTTAAIRLRLWSTNPRRVTIERAGQDTSRTVDIRAREVATVVIGGVRVRAGRGRLILKTTAPPPGRNDSRRLALQLLSVSRVQ